MTTNPEHEILNPQQYQMNKIQKVKAVLNFEFGILNLFGA